MALSQAKGMPLPPPVCAQGKCKGSQRAGAAADHQPLPQSSNLSRTRGPLKTIRQPTATWNWEQDYQIRNPHLHLRIRRARPLGSCLFRSILKRVRRPLTPSRPHKLSRPTNRPSFLQRRSGQGMIPIFVPHSTTKTIYKTPHQCQPVALRLRRFATAR